MSLALLRTTLRRPLLPALTRTYQIQAHPEAYTSKNQEFFIAASFPDDFESPTLTEKRGVPTPSWDEMHATLSEAVVKADRGEIKMQQLTSREELERMLQPENMDPKIDEM
ncbi:hypothetical protein BDV28DRAFT_161909 [Aspergillus coremiiformis]|uniref:Uncharacterized protein n=1 Tax=Aspergillus coremiiformis TaxID=138285 RepID=A0A5N6Z5Q0_9EURO|nr:hypothetical protein BDV28DRAFT_161909 [Aspergillus coremiiformis]